MANGADNYCPLLTNHKTNSHAWTILFVVKQNAINQSTKLITSLNPKHYRSSGILIHQHNLYAPHSQGAPVAVNWSTKVRTSLYNEHNFHPRHWLINIWTILYFQRITKFSLFGLTNKRQTGIQVFLYLFTNECLCQYLIESVSLLCYTLPYHSYIYFKMNVFVNT
jgi:hypothetical protein